MGWSFGEEWRSTVGDYLVSSLGRVRHRRVNAPIIKGTIDDDGYIRVRLTVDGKRAYRVHRLVCEAFHGAAPDNHEVAHFDGVRSNNRAENLRWATRAENMADAARHGTLHNGFVAGANHRNAKLSAEQVAEIRASNEPHRQIARRFGVGEAAIRKIRSMKTWA